MTSFVYECHNLLPLPFTEVLLFIYLFHSFLKYKMCCSKFKVITLQREKYTTVSNVVLSANHDTKLQNSIPHEIRHSLPVPALT